MKNIIVSKLKSMLTEQPVKKEETQEEMLKRWAEEAKKFELAVKMEEVVPVAPANDSPEDSDEEKKRTGYDAGKAKANDDDDDDCDHDEMEECGNCKGTGKVKVEKKAEEEEEEKAQAPDGGAGRYDGGYADPMSENLMPVKEEKVQDIMTQKLDLDAAFGRPKVEIAESNFSKMLNVELMKFQTSMLPKQ